MAVLGEFHSEVLSVALHNIKGDKTGSYLSVGCFDGNVICFKMVRECDERLKFYLQWQSHGFLLANQLRIEHARIDKLAHKLLAQRGAQAISFAIAEKIACIGKVVLQGYDQPLNSETLSSCMEQFFSMKRHNIVALLENKLFVFKQWLANNLLTTEVDKVQKLHHLSQALVDEVFGVPLNFDRLHYLALLTDRAGVLFASGLITQLTSTKVSLPNGIFDGRTLEKCSRDDFLLMRFYTLAFFWLHENFLANPVDNKSITSPYIERLEQELYLFNIAYRIGILSQKAADWCEQWVAADFDDLAERTSRFFECFAESIIGLLQRLQVEEELFIPTGDKNHAVYVSIQRKRDSFEVRIDNCLLNQHNEGERRRHPKRQKGEERVSKYVFHSVYIGSVPFSPSFDEKNSFVEFLSHCFKTYTLDASLDSLYNTTLKKSDNFKSIWPYKREQSVQNCVVKNHNYGMMWRFFKDQKMVDGPDNREYYKKFRCNERGLVAYLKGWR